MHVHNQMVTGGDGACFSALGNDVRDPGDREERTVDKCEVEAAVH